MSEIRQRGDRCWRGRDRWGSKGGQLDVWNLMRAENWKEDRRDINAEGREEGERGDGVTVERKQMEDKNKMVGMETTEDTESRVQTEMGADAGLKTPPGHYLLEPPQTLELISWGAGWRE